MKLSIVIAAYNEEDYVGKCIESVFRELEGCERDVEVIVVNNASTDRTKDVASSYQGVRVIDEERKGLVRARSAGFVSSSGDIVANLDSDGSMPPGWIGKVFSEFERDDKLIALSGPYRYPDMSVVFNAVVKLWYSIGLLFHYFNQYVLHRGAMLQGGNFIVRRDAMERIGGFDTSIEFYGEDTDVACRIQKVGKVKFTFDLPMNTSDRRFKGDGIIKTGFNYGINHIWPIIFGRPFSFSYNDFRGKEKTANKN